MPEPFMSEKSLETGLVYGKRLDGSDNGYILDAETYFPTMDQVAKDFFTLWNRIPLTERHKKVIDTVDGLIAEDITSYAERRLKFLDVGGSNGSRILDIERRLPFGLEKHLIDIDGDSVAEAKERRIKALQLDVGQKIFPYEDETFDAVSLFWVLEHMHPDRHNHVIEEIYRVLKPGGILYLQDDIYGDNLGYKQAFEFGLKPKGYEEGTFFLGIFEPTGRESRFPEEIRQLIHSASDADPAYKLLRRMYGRAFSLSTLEKTTCSHFGDPEGIHLIELHDSQRAGTILASGKEDVKRYRRAQKEWAVFLAVLKKK
jgi:SAM-dependent methyltransferase